MNGPSGWLLADVGNTRTKLAWLAHGLDAVPKIFEEGGGKWDERLTLPADSIRQHERSIADWLASKTVGGIWISSVRPAAMQELVHVLEVALEASPQEDAPGLILTSAADCGMSGRLTRPEKTGADRALAVRAALRLMGGRGPGIVILCGTAITVERLDAHGDWLGGAIAPGYRLAAEALDQGTAGLMRVGMVDQEPFAYGTETRTAIEAGLFWGLVGGVKELIARSAGGQEHWQVWSGGDAPMIHRWVAGQNAVLAEDLVLLGLADWAESRSLSNSDENFT